MRFVPVEEIQETADTEFERYRELLLELLPGANVQHVGSTAVPGSITKGDLDIQVSVSGGDFENAKAVLRSRFNPRHENTIWTDGFASFEDHANPAIPVGIQLTVVGSAYDDFANVRDVLRSNRELLERYNALKRRFEGKSEAEYKKAKRELFGPNGQTKIL